jgi:hypothetical protein
MNYTMDCRGGRTLPARHIVLEDRLMNAIIRRCRLGVAALLLAAAACTQTATAGPVVTVYLTPTCGCCKYWADHMRENGFTVNEVMRADLAPIRQKYGVPGSLISCHTAVIDGYAVEGHVPADAIERLLRERPDVRGIAVPGMPHGSPGMEQLGAKWEPYEVFTFNERGPLEVFEVRNVPGR